MRAEKARCARAVLRWHKLYGVVVLLQVERRQGDVLVVAVVFVRVAVVTVAVSLVAALAVVAVLGFTVPDVSLAQALALHSLHFQLPRALEKRNTFIKHIRHCTRTATDTEEEEDEHGTISFIWS